MPRYIISQNHFSKSLLKIFAQNLTTITRAHAPGRPVPVRRRWSKSESALVQKLQNVFVYFHFPTRRVGWLCIQHVWAINSSWFLWFCLKFLPRRAPEKSASENENKQKTIRKENDKNISTKIINILIILKWLLQQLSFLDHPSTK